MKKLNPIVQYTCLLLAIYQIIFGFIGFYILVEKFNSGSFLDAFTTTIFTFPFYLLSAFAGFWLLTSRSFKLSYLNFFLQSISFYVAGLGYYFSAGPFFGVGILINDSFEIYYQYNVIHVACFIRTGGDDPQSFIMLNVIAVLMFIFLPKLQALVEKEKDVDKLSN